jgi:hypothetical protein
MTAFHDPCIQSRQPAQTHIRNRFRPPSPVTFPFIIIRFRSSPSLSIRSTTLTSCFHDRFFSPSFLLLVSIFVCPLSSVSSDAPPVPVLVPARLSSDHQRHHTLSFPSHQSEPGPAGTSEPAGKQNNMLRSMGKHLDPSYDFDSKNQRTV